MSSSVMQPAASAIKMGVWIGIDPGVSGGIAWFDMSGLAHAAKMPVTLHDVVDLISDAAELKRSFCYLERVGTMPGQGVASSGKFMAHFGAMQGILSALAIPYDLVTPTVWQRRFGLVRKDKKESITAKKNRHKAMAQRMFPAIKFTHATADAMLLAEFTRQRMENGS